MKSKDFILRIAGSIFGIVSLLHLLRIITHTTVIIGGWPLPLWVNVFGLIGAGFLCFIMWRLSMKKDNS